MYTVLKFYSSLKDLNVLSVIGESLNKIPEDIFSERDYSGGRFVCSVSDSADWNDHVEAIGQFLHFFEEVIAVANANRIGVEFNLAVEIEDSEEKVYVSGSFEPAILKRLADQNVRLTLTYYVPR